MLSLGRERIKSIFERANAVITCSHFVYALKEDGWYHSSAYVNKDALFHSTNSLILLCREIALHFADSQVDYVIGPETGGAKVAQYVANSLSAYHKEVFTTSVHEEDVIEEKKVVVLATKEMHFIANGLVKVEASQNSYTGGGFNFKALFQIKTGTKRVFRGNHGELLQSKRCGIVEDVITTGLTVRKTITAIEEAGGLVAWVGALCNRSGGRVTAQTLEVPELFSLLGLKMEMFREAECPLCKEYGPESVRTDLGKGKEFLTRIGKI